MEENLLIEPPQLKIYKENAVLPAAFFGGPLAAGYIIAENFKLLGEKQKVKTTWVITILVTIVIFGATIFILNDKVPNYLIPLIYTLAAQQIVRRIQGDAIKQHIEMGGQLFSNWRAFLVGLIGLLITIVVFVGILLLVNPKDLQ